MPEIEEAEKHKDVQQLDARGEERGEGCELGQMPSRDGSHHKGKGEQAGVEEHEHLDQDLPVEACHTRVRSKLIDV